MLDLPTAELIGNLYEGIDDRDRWRTAMRSLLDLSGARFLFFGVIDSSSDSMPETGIIGPETSHLDDGWRLHQDLIAIDPGLPYALSRPEGGNFRFCQTSGALTSEPDEWRNYIQGDLGSSDYHSRFSAQTEGVTLVLAMHAEPGTPGLSPEQQKIHGLVFSHMERAVRLEHQARQAARTEPLVTVDANAQVLMANDAALAVLRRHDGLSIQRGKLAAADGGTNRLLGQAINEICRITEYGAAARFLRVWSPRLEKHLMLRMSPEPVEFGVVTKAVFRCSIELVEPSAPEPIAPGMLSDLFGLTPREAELASLFGGPCSDLPSAARRLGISHETARVHLRAILSKCEVCNQVELVRLLSSLR